MLIQDENRNCISYGTLDNINMNRMGEFRDVRVTSSETINGKKTIWTVAFDAIAVVKKGDIFTIGIPHSVKTPTDPICEPQSCLE